MKKSVLYFVAVVFFPLLFFANISLASCESGHWIESVTDDGEILKLEDGSVWEVSAADTVDSSLWLPVSNIIICNDEVLINADEGERVEAVHLR